MSRYQPHGHVMQKFFPIFKKIQRNQMLRLQQNAPIPKMDFFFFIFVKKNANRKRVEEGEPIGNAAPFRMPEYIFG